MVQLKSVQELLERFNSLELVKAESNKSFELEGGLKVSYSIKTHTASVSDGMTFQAVVHVVKDGVCVYTWGCENEEENRAVVIYFARKESEGFTKESELRKKNEKFARTLLGL